MPFFDNPPLRDFPDRAFRLLLAQPANLREAVEHVAPELAPRFDFPRAKLLDRELPLPDWRRREADLLFHIPFLTSQEQSALVCLLLEHQSAPDQSMPLRTLLYAVLFWEQEWKTWEEKKQRGQALRLSPVLPIVFHTGAEPWSTHKSMADLIQAPEPLRTFVPTWQPLFWDLSSQTPQELLQHVGIWHNALSVVRGEAEDPAVFHELYQELLARLAKLQQSDHVRWHDLIWFVFSWAVRRRPKMEKDKLLAVTESSFCSNQSLQEEIQSMTRQVIKTWTDEMLEQGKEIGREIGKEIGMLEAMRDSLRTSLEERFGQVPTALLLRIAEQSDLKRLREGFRQSFKIKSLDELTL